LQQNPTIRIAPDPNFLPIEHIDSQGIYTGIAADYMQLLEKKIGIKFTLIQTKNWQQSIELMQQRQADVWPIAAASSQRLSYMNFTAPYLSIPAVILVRDSNPNSDIKLSDLKNKRVLVLSNYAFHDYVSTKHPWLKVIPEQDIKLALRDISTGAADAFIVNLAAGIYYMEELGIENIKISGETGFNYDLALGVRNDKPTLISILQTGLDNITEKEKMEIYWRWVNTDTSDRYSMKEVAISILTVLTIGVVIVTIFWNFLLKREVKSRTNALENELTEHRKTEKQLDVFAKVFETATEGIVITDPDLNIVKINKACCDATGFTEKNVIGRHVTEFQDKNQDNQIYLDAWDSINSCGHWTGELSYRKKDGNYLPIWVNFNSLKNKWNETAFYIGMFSDISDLKSNEEKLRHQAYFDSLTGLPNRMNFKERVRSNIADSHRHNKQFAIMFMDLDRFKFVNDTLGHAIGDLLLITAAHRIKKALRETDTVARLGGDEFTIIVTDAEHNERLGAVAEKILNQLEKPMKLEGHDIYVTGSIGIAIYPEDGEDFDTLTKHADAAMYQAKDSTGDSYHFFQPEINEVAEHRMALERELRKAADLHQLEVYYQPKVDTRDGKLKGLEALIRWHHPDLGDISPGEFIPVAEDTGLIVDLGYWIFHQVCRDVKKWSNENYVVPQVSINISPRQFHQKDLVEQLIKSCEETDINPNQLELEVTEGLVINNLDLAISMLQKLRDLGFSIAMDDFGTGYSSLSYLKKMPLDIVKIDQSFVRDMCNNRDDEAIITAIISMAHSLDLEVVAEGVETEQQLNFLKQHGCDLMQGYYFGVPTPTSEISKFLAVRTRPQKRMW